MRTVVLDMQSGLYASAVRRALAQELTDTQVLISPRPEETAEQCRLLQPNVLVMEVTGHSPWLPEQRLALREEVRRGAPECRVVLLVDEAADRTLSEEVKRAKQDGHADAFLFTSATERYLAAVLDSL